MQVNGRYPELFNPGSTQLVVQIIATVLGLLHVFAVATLINYFTRMRLASRTATSLDSLLLWHSLLSKSFNWDLPLQSLIVLLVFLGFSAIPAAVWAAAITPIDAVQFGHQPINIGSYSNITLFNHSSFYNPGALPTLVTKRGTFSYGPSLTILGGILNSAASATTIDGSVRQHAKLDQTHFTYNGRSYGIGASVGLLDDHILANPLATQYTFQETGYMPTVSWIYNASSAFYIVDDAADNAYIDTNYVAQSHALMYESFGCPPCLSGTQTYCGGDRYPGYGTLQIVALAVCPDIGALPYQMSIASGARYPNLNNTQCTVEFHPTLFNVTVNTAKRNITVLPLKNTTEVPDIEPAGILGNLVMEMFQFIAAGQANIMVSIVGNSFNSSISNYMTQMNISQHTPEATEATLRGLENSAAAMMDDTLVAFASAQIMLANVTSSVPAAVALAGLQIGEPQYIWAIVLLNTVILIVVAGEALRTRGWRGLTDFDYMDPRNLVVGSSRGGRDIAGVVDDMTAEDGDTSGRSSSSRIGDVKIRQEGSKFVADSKVFKEWI